MQRHRLFIQPPLREQERTELTGDRAHYLCRVLRLKTGDAVGVFCGDGREYAARVLESRKSVVTLQVENQVRCDPEPTLSLRLLQGVSRGERMDFAVQKSTELGVAEIVPLLTEHTVVRVKGERAVRRAAHWQRIAEGACEQCGRTRVPHVATPLTWQEQIRHLDDADLRIVCIPGTGDRVAQIEGPQPTSIDVLVGPEGGLSDREISEAGAAGFQTLSLGPRVLRSETATVVALTLLQSRWGDL